jgi:ketosteroid isomerase-like protein
MKLVVVRPDKPRHVIARAFRPLAGLVIAIITAGSVLAAEPDLRPVLEARYAAMHAAIAARDKNAISTLFTRDFVSVGLANQTKNAVMMFQEAASSSSDPNRESRTTLTNITRDGDTAVVTQRYDMTTKMAGENGKMHALRLTTSSTDTWVNANETWRMKRTVTEQFDYAVDGKVVVHKVRAN